MLKIHKFDVSWRSNQLATRIVATLNQRHRRLCDGLCEERQRGALREINVSTLTPRGRHYSIDHNFIRTCSI